MSEEKKEISHIIIVEGVNNWVLAGINLCIQMVLNAEGVVQNPSEITHLTSLMSKIAEKEKKKETTEFKMRLSDEDGYTVWKCINFCMANEMVPARWQPYIVPVYEDIAKEIDRIIFHDQMMNQSPLQK